MASTVDIQPTLEGPSLLLRPVAAADFDALYQAASDPHIWEQHPDSERYQREVFDKRFFQSALDCGGAVVILDKARQRIIGSSRYYEWQPEQLSIAIGYTFIERQYWGGQTNGELKRLMLTHIAQWADTVWFHIGDTNLRSILAIEKLGAVLKKKEPRDQHGKRFNQLYYRLDATRYRKTETKP
ncbi:MAG: GNAT family N-acetyltransferase [Pseudomonadota bacterium]